MLGEYSDRWVIREEVHEAIREMKVEKAEDLDRCVEACLKSEAVTVGWEVSNIVQHMILYLFLVTNYHHHYYIIMIIIFISSSNNSSSTILLPLQQNIRQQLKGKRKAEKNKKEKRRTKGSERQENERENRESKE